MIATASFLAILFIGVFVSMGHGRGPYTNADFAGQYNQTMQSSLDKNITCKDGFNRRSNSTRRVIIDPITVVPVLQDVPKKKTQKIFQPQVQKKIQPQAEEPQAEKPPTYLRNGYYSQLI